MKNHYKCVVNIPQATERMSIADVVPYFQNRIHMDAAEYLARNFHPTECETGAGKAMSLELYVFTPEELKKYVAEKTVIY